MLRLCALMFLICVPAQAETVKLGQKLFGLHCAACHGANGQGNGNMAPALTIAPSDLTQLSSANDGAFPTQKIVAQIDGRASFAGHGGDMPVYGWFFESPSATISSPKGQRITTTQNIAALVAWLSSIQDAP